MRISEFGSYGDCPPVPGELLIRGTTPGDSRFCYDKEMRDLVILFVHVIATLARLLGPGGIRSVVAESVLVKQQLLILNRSRQRSPNLRTSDRLVAGLCALLMRPAPPDPFGNRTESFDSFDPPPGSEEPKVSPALLIQSQA